MERINWEPVKNRMFETVCSGIRMAKFEVVLILKRIKNDSLMQVFATINLLNVRTRATEQIP